MFSSYRPLAGLLLLLISNLQAQPQVRTLPFVSLPPGTFQFADAGNYTGDARISVAFAAGGDVHVAFDPVLHTGIFATGVTQATGLVTWSSGSPTVADKLVVTCASAAVLVANNAGAFTFNNSPTLNYRGTVRPG